MRILGKSRSGVRKRTRFQDEEETPLHAGRDLSSRSQQLRRQHRKILGWSIAVAVVAHVLVLFFGPWFPSSLATGPRTELVEGTAPPFGGLAVTVIFDAPALEEEDGSLAQEPDWRILSASRSIPPPIACRDHDWLALPFAKGRVWMTVGDTGRPDTVTVAESTGDRCWDGVMVGLAGDLRYRWLPNDDFAAPVEVFQPVTLTLTGY